MLNKTEKFQDFHFNLAILTFDFLGYKSCSVNMIDLPCFVSCACVVKLHDLPLAPFLSLQFICIKDMHIVDNHCQNLSPELFHLSTLTLMSIKQYLLIPRLPQALAAAILLSVPESD